MQAYYPAFLKLDNRLCVVVGGGEVATRKTLALLECHAVVRVVSPLLSPRLAALADAGLIEYLEREYEAGALAGAFLAVAATGSKDVNQNVAAHCAEFNIPVNVVDAPELGSFIAPAAFRRGPLTVAVSTAGSAPAVARSIKRRLEEMLDESYGELLVILADTRRRVLNEVEDPHKRKEIFIALADEELLTVLRDGGKEALHTRIDQIIGGF